jgi:hypothetical protein
MNVWSGGSRNLSGNRRRGKENYNFSSNNRRKSLGEAP